MSMSQEEIEALMNGLDIDENESQPEEAVEEVSVNTEEIEQLLSQTEDIDVESDKSVQIEENTNNSNENSSDAQTNIINNNELDELLKDIEENTENKEESLDSHNSQAKDIESLKDLDEEIEKENIIKEDVEKSQNDTPTDENINEDEIAKSWTNSRIDEGIFPLPAEKDTKVVTQLSEVANDSEEKVSQIFDVLSLSLDNNNNIRNEIKNIQSFLEQEKKLLENLTAKFPNISLFNKHLSEISKINDNITVINNNTFDEDGKIFEAMELMQFNDINRQKIERVMSVIRKLSMYLNNLFEDDGSTSEIAVARHIHGDDTQDLIGDDLDKLIDEFSNKE